MNFVHLLTTVIDDNNHSNKAHARLYCIRNVKFLMTDLQAVSVHQTRLKMRTIADFVVLLI